LPDGCGATNRLGPIGIPYRDYRERFDVVRKTSELKKKCGRRWKAGREDFVGESVNYGQKAIASFDVVAAIASVPEPVDPTPAVRSPCGVVA